MKVWVTKYALTTGIRETNARICDNVNPDMIEDLNNKYTYYHGEGREWHRSLALANKKADQMRLRKIASLQKHIDKLNKLSFK